MQERTLERWACKYAAGRGWLSLKLPATNQRGLPDRLFLHDGRVIFVEFKAPGKAPTPLQHVIHERLRAHGGDVRVIDSREGVRDAFAE